MTVSVKALSIMITNGKDIYSIILGKNMHADKQIYLERVALIPQE